MFFSLNPRVVLRYEPQFYSTYAAFNSERTETHFCSRWEFEVLSSLAKRPSQLDEISEQVNVDKDRMIDFVTSQVKSSVIMEVEDRNIKPVPVPPRASPEAFKKFPLPFLSAPSTVDIFLTHACNLRCCHCFAEGGLPLENELSYEEWISVFDQLEEMGVLQIRLTGGEPFMRRRIYDILDKLRGRRYHKLLITNGTLLTEKAVDAMIKAGIKPTVSLDGATAEVHDAFRGVPGCYEKTLKGVRLLQRKGMTFGLNTCIHSGNLEQIEDIIRRGIKLGAVRIGLLGLIEVGRLAKTKKSGVSGRQTLMSGLRTLNLARKYRDKIELVEEILSDEIPLDSIGVLACSIDSDGSVYPANRVLGSPKHRVGNVRQASLREIWFSKNWVPFRKGSGKLRALGLEQLSLQM